MNCDNGEDHRHPSYCKWFLDIVWGTIALQYVLTVVFCQLFLSFEFKPTQGSLCLALSLSLSPTSSPTNQPPPTLTSWLKYNFLSDLIKEKAYATTRGGVDLMQHTMEFHYYIALKVKWAKKTTTIKQQDNAHFRCKAGYSTAKTPLNIHIFLSRKTGFCAIDATCACRSKSTEPMQCNGNTNAVHY